MRNIPSISRSLPAVMTPNLGFKTYNDGHEKVWVSGSIPVKTEHYDIFHLEVRWDIEPDYDGPDYTQHFVFSPPHRSGNWRHDLKANLVALRQNILNFREGLKSFKHDLFRARAYSYLAKGEEKGLEPYADAYLAATRDRKNVSLRQIIHKMKQDAQYPVVKEEQAKKAKSAAEMLRDASFFIEDRNLILASSDKQTIICRVELGSMLGENNRVIVGFQELSQISLENTDSYSRTNEQNTYGFVVCDPEYLHEVDAIKCISKSDYRNASEQQCGHKAASEATFLECERTEGHAGDHQTVLGETPHISYWRWDDEATTTRYYYIHDRHSWDGRGLLQRRVLDYGFRSTCSYCGFVSAGGPDGIQTCLKCSSWEDRLKEGVERGFTVDGKYYSIRNYDLEGKELQLLKDDGEIWIGECYEPVSIPNHLRPLFPDNASLIEGGK